MFRVTSQWIGADGRTLPISESAHRIKSLPGMLHHGVLDSLRTSVLIVERSVKHQVSGRSKTLDTLQRQTGKLAQSVRSEVIPSRAMGIVSSDKIYAKTHETGDVIEPRRRKWLTIPIEGALGKKARNIPRATEFTDLIFIIKSPTKGVAGVVRGGKFKAVYLLRKKVTIPRRAPFEKAFEKEKDELPEIFRGEVGNVLREAGLMR